LTLETVDQGAASEAAGYTGIQKVAILLLHIGKERAAKVLKEMPEQDVEDITSEIARLGRVTPEAVKAVLEEFEELLAARSYVAQGGVDFARDILEASVGTGKAREIVERLQASMVEQPFEFLRKADPRQVLSFLQDEHPQTVALVLAHMSIDHAASVLSGLPDELQADVAFRLAQMDRTSPEVVAQVESVLERRLSSVIQSGESATVGGVQPLVDILNRSDRATERLILEGLESLSPELAEEVRSRMFVFEDIVTLDDRSVQLVLRQVDQKQLALALKGVREDVKIKITSNMSERASTLLQEEIDLLGPVRLRNVEESQGAVVRVIRALEEEGQIVVSRGAADEFVV
jgi:flagellar motor switch protein FliG